MHPGERDREGPTEIAEPSTEDGPALRDAARVAERAALDEAAAADARERYRTQPLPSLTDDRVAAHLSEGEQVHSLRTSAILLGPGDATALGYGGTLYLTSQRLIHLGQVIVTVQLTDVAETSLAGERLLLTLRNGDGLRLDIDRPRLFRTELAAATRGRRP
jgi:hypothetical protein